MLQLVILRYNEAMGAALVHLLTTNLCIWADVSVGKIDKTLSYGKQWKTGEVDRSTMPDSVSNLTGPIMTSYPLDGDITSSLEDHSQSYNLVDVSFYLLPTVSEYCLLAAALLYEIVMRIGQPTFIEIEKPHETKQVSLSIKH